MNTLRAAIAETAAELTRLQAELGGDYWQDARVAALQATLRRLIGQAGAWGKDRPMLHRRARDVAELEHRYARLLWPGVDGD
jgi:hypothetical protein